MMNQEPRKKSGKPVATPPCGVSNPTAVVTAASFFPAAVSPQIFTDAVVSKVESIFADHKRRQTTEENYASLNLVHSCRVDRGTHREIGYARAHDDFLDNRARHHRIDHRRRRYTHVYAPGNRTISSRRPHFFHSWRDPAPLHLH